MRGCNLRCPYCYNTELVEARDAAIFVPIHEILAHLKKRANVLSGFVISGGEPLCQPDLVRRLILEARALGYKIKLDTNGMFPDRLQKLLDDSAARPDYIALDVKTSPARYKELQAGGNAPQAQNAAASLAFETFSEKIIRSIKIISSLAADAREFRTVLYPPLVARAEIEEIAALLPADASWYFAKFQNNHCLCAAAENVAPYTDEEEAALVDLARSKISGAELR